MGIAHLAAGLAFGIADGVTGSACAHTRGCRNEGGSLNPMTAEIILGTSGLLLTTIGAPMWVIGEKERKAAEISVSAGGVRVRF
jgi:hypothetical protein